MLFDIHLKLNIIGDSLTTNRIPFYICIKKIPTYLLDLHVKYVDDRNIWLKLEFK